MIAINLLESEDTRQGQVWIYIPSSTCAANQVEYLAWFRGLVSIDLSHKVLKNQQRRQAANTASI